MTGSRQACGKWSLTLPDIPSHAPISREGFLGTKARVSTARLGFCDVCRLSAQLRTVSNVFVITGRKLGMMKAHTGQASDAPRAWNMSRPLTFRIDLGHLIQTPKVLDKNPLKAFSSPQPSQEGCVMSERFDDHMSCG